MLGSLSVIFNHTIKRTKWLPGHVTQDRTQIQYITFSQPLARRYKSVQLSKTYLCSLQFNNIMSGSNKGKGIDKAPRYEEEYDDEEMDKDNWKPVTDRSERRRIQNRLSQRTHRQSANFRFPILTPILARFIFMRKKCSPNPEIMFHSSCS
jgi:hypothetical protein